MPRLSLRCTFAITFLMLACVATRANLKSSMASRDSGDATGRIHVVQVGKDAGVAFDPDTLSADVGDSVIFEISSLGLTVSQSRSLTRPCARTATGFSSSQGESPFILHVDDTEPILVHCEQFCDLGMVMIVNPARESDITTMIHAASHGVLPMPSDDGDADFDPPSSHTVHTGHAASSPVSAAESTTPTRTLSSLSNGGSNGTASASTQPGSETPSRRPQAHGSKPHQVNVAAAVAASLVAVTILAAVGAWYIWRRRIRRSPRNRDAAGIMLDLGASATFPPTTRPEDAGITPFVRDETAPLADGSTKSKKKLLVPADPMVIQKRGNRDIPPEAAGTEMVQLHAELDRMLAENERMLAENAILRQRTEPPAYSEDGALEGDTDGVAVSKQV